MWKVLNTAFYLNNILYVPSINQNIFSVQAAFEKGALIKFSQNSVSLTTGNGVKFKIKKYDQLYYLNKCVMEHIRQVKQSQNVA